MLVVMAEKKIGARSLRPSSRVPRERAALTGLRDAAGAKDTQPAWDSLAGVGSKGIKRPGPSLFDEHDHLASVDRSIKRER